MYVVIGANGFLGAYVRKAILEMTKEPILATARDIAAVPADSGTAANSRIRWISCRIESEEEVRRLSEEMRTCEENKVIFLAAYHHPDQVAKHPREAWQINIIALSKILNMLDRVSEFYYPSTDSVYGNGAMDHYFEEEEALHPVNLYGKQKAAAESLVTACGYHVVRFPFLIAPSLLPHKRHFYDELTASLQSGQPIRMFQDSYRSALDFGTAAQLLIRLIEKKEPIPSILNLAGDEALSKYEIGLRLAKKLGVSEELVQPVSALEQNQIFEAKRAPVTLMNNRKVKQILGLEHILLQL